MLFRTKFLIQHLKRTLKRQFLIQELISQEILSLDRVYLRSFFIKWGTHSKCEYVIKLTSDERIPPKMIVGFPTMRIVFSREISAQNPALMYACALPERGIILKVLIMWFVDKGGSVTFKMIWPFMSVSMNCGKVNCWISLLQLTKFRKISTFSTWY